MSNDKIQELVNKYKKSNNKLYDSTDFVISVFTTLKKPKEQKELMEFINKNKSDISSDIVELYLVIKHRKLDIDTNDINNIKALLE